MVTAARTAEGDTDRVLRDAMIARGRGEEAPVPGELAQLADAVRDEPIDADIAQVLSCGHSEDAVFELVIATAVGASARRVDAAYAALQALEERDS